MRALLLVKLTFACCCMEISPMLEELKPFTVEIGEKVEIQVNIVDFLQGVEIVSSLVI